jgi:pimeloyl-ACP methyl ester carboxylesterase
MKSHFLFLLLSTFSSSILLAQKQDTIYTEKPIVLKTATGDISGTLALPARKGCPVALIIAGSGPTDRNGNSMFTNNNSLQLLARELAKAGIATVRFDKRGVAKSAQALKREADLRFEDYIKDAVAWIQMLKKDKQFNGVVVIGHSEGALIGMVAAATAGAKKYVSIAGTARPIDEILMEQLLASSKELHDMSVPIVDSLKKGLLVTNVDNKLATIFRPSVQPYMISWLKYNPQKEIKKLNIPVLLVQGTNDIQVPAEEARLLSAAKPAAQLKLIPNMNHVLKQVAGDRAANAATYKDPNLPLAPGLADTIAAFIKKK